MSDVQVVRSDEKERYEITVDGGVAGYTEFVLASPGRVIYPHTETDPAFGGRGAYRERSYDDRRERPEPKPKKSGERIAKAVAQHADKLDIIVHNAGITRDKLFVNTDEARWGSVLDVNLQSQFRMNKVLLDPSVKGGLKDGGRIALQTAKAAAWA